VNGELRFALLFACALFLVTGGFVGSSVAKEALFVAIDDGTIKKFDLNVDLTTQQGVVIGTVAGTPAGLICSLDGRLTIALSGFQGGPRQLVSLGRDGSNPHVLLDFASTPELQNSGGPEGPSSDAAGVVYFNTRPAPNPTLTFPHTGTWKWAGAGASPVQILSPFALGACSATISAEATAFLTAGPYAGNLIAADQCNNRVVRRAPPFDSPLTPIDFLAVPAPNGLATDKIGNIYVADNASDVVRRFTPDGIELGVYASVGAGLQKIVFDSNGNLYATRNGGALRVAPNGTPTAFGNFVRANGVAVCGTGDLTGPETIETVAGSGSNWADPYGSFSGDGGPATSAQLGVPISVALDAAGNLLISDSCNNRIRKVEAATGIITTVVGIGPSSGCSSGSFSGDGGLAVDAGLDIPQGIAVDASGNLFIADPPSQRVRRVDTSGIITTVAGDGNAGFLGDGGAATSARLNDPKWVAVDQTGNLFISEDNNHRVRRVDTSGVITTVAGNGSSSVSGDGGLAVDAGIGTPYGITVDGNGNLFIVDTANNVVRRVDAVTGIISTVAGTGTVGFFGDGGPATSAEFDGPQQIAFDPGGNLYVSDTGNQRIRKIDLTGIITTVAGTGTRGFSGDGGQAISAELSDPSGLVFDSSGNLFMTVYHRIRKIAAGSSTGSSLAALGSAHLWVGLRNSDDQGTQFDLKIEVLRNGAPVAQGLRRCITGLTRSPSLATEAVVAFDPFTPVALTPGDVLALKVSTRIGTNSDGTKCPGPGGSHNNATGLRLYYEAASRPTRFAATIAPDPSADRYLHSNGTACGSTQSSGVTTQTLDTTAPPSPDVKCKDSGAVNLAGGNPYSVIGTWSLTVP
jgi:sugar lactone lactonase YvrE